MLSRLIQCILSYFFIILKTSCSTSDLIYEETFQSTTKSLGLKLSQELQILGFAPRSPAQARGVKTGDILIKVNEEDLEAQGPKGLSKLTTLMRTLPFPRTFRFKRVGAGTNEKKETTETSGKSDENNGGFSSSQSSQHRNDDADAFATINQRGISVLKYHAVFPRNERVGLHFDDTLTIIGFAHGSHGEMYAAEQLKNVNVGDVLYSINHDSDIVENLLTKRWPSISALHLIESLQPPLILGFSKVVKEKTSLDVQLEEMRQANHIDEHSNNNIEKLDAHSGDHIDIALVGTHHNHDSGNYDHHTTNTFKIMRANYGPPPSCIRKPIRAVQPLNGCGDISNARYIEGSYAIVVRGGCNFIEKTRAVQRAGAVGLIVINTGGGMLLKMPGAQFGMDDMNDIKIPSIMVEHRAYEIVERELISDYHGRGEGINIGGGRHDRWTSRIVLVDGECIEKEKIKEKQKENEMVEENRDGGGGGENRVYTVGPRGRALYENYERAKVHHPILGGLMIVSLGIYHPSESMRLEFLLSPHGQVYSKDTELENKNLYFALKWENISNLCSSNWVKNMAHLNQEKQEDDERGSKNTIIVTNIPYQSIHPICGIQDLVTNVQNAGYGGVAFVTQSVVLLRAEDLVSVKGSWWENHVNERPNIIKIPIMTLSVGDGNRILKGFGVDSSDGKENIVCTIYPDREVVSAWEQLKMLSSPEQWPYSIDGRRRLMHRMFKLAPKSASRTEAITKCAENAEHYYYHEQEQQRFDEL